MPKTIIVKTITPIYDTLEDRLRISVNYQDISNRIDLMVTRSFMIRLLDNIGDYLLQSYPEQTDKSPAIKPVQANTSQDRSENTSHSATNLEDLELYRSDEDLLITLHLTLEKKSMRTQVVFVSKQKHQVILSADETMLRNVLSSFHTAIPKMQWGIATHWG